jgi:hypothetical protein
MVSTYSTNPGVADFWLIVFERFINTDHCQNWAFIPVVLSGPAFSGVTHRGQIFGVLFVEPIGPVNLLGFQGAQARANALHDPDLPRRSESQSPEELGGRGLGWRGVADGNQPAREDFPPISEGQLIDYISRPIPLKKMSASGMIGLGDISIFCRMLGYWRCQSLRCCVSIISGK